VPARIISGRTAALLAGLAEYHTAHPLQAGPGLEDAKARWFRGVAPAVVEAVIAGLVAEKQVTATDTLSLAGHRPTLSADESALEAWIDERYRTAGLAPPDAALLPAEARKPAPLVERVVQHMVKTKVLVRLDTLVFHRDVLDVLKREIAERKAQAADGRATVDVKTFKDTYNVTRKYAIPLLEFLDRERVTRRMGEARVVL
jgi:selenocysteine-specific elongation factor